MVVIHVSQNSGRRRTENEYSRESIQRVNLITFSRLKEAFLLNSIVFPEARNLNYFYFFLFSLLYSSYMIVVNELFNFIASLIFKEVDYSFNWWVFILFPLVMIGVKIVCALIMKYYWDSPFSSNCLYMSFIFIHCIAVAPILMVVNMILFPFLNDKMGYKFFALFPPVFLASSLFSLGFYTKIESGVFRDVVLNVITRFIVINFCVIPPYVLIGIRKSE